MVSPAAQDPQSPHRLPTRGPVRLRPWLRPILLSVLLWAVWTAASIWLLSPDTIDRAVGETAPFDVQAPREVAYESQVETETARRLAATAVADVYTAPDPKIYAAQQQSLEQITRYITVLRNDQFLRVDRRVQLLLEIRVLELDREQANALGGVNALSDAAWQAAKQEAARLLEIGLRQPVRESSLGDSRRSLALLASRSLSPEQSTLAVHLASHLLAPNSFLDALATDAARQAARDAIQPVQVRIRQGETIVRQGAAITPLAYEKLGQLGYLDRDLDWRSFVRAGLQAAVLVALLSIYIARVRPSLLPHPRRQVLFFLVIAALAISAPWAVPGHTLLPYAYPAAGAAMLVALFLGIDLAALVVVVATVIVGLASAGSMELTIYTLLGGITGALVLWKTEQLGRFVRAGLLVILMNLVVIFSFRINDPDLNPRALVELTAAAALNGALSASLAFIAYSFTGRLFGITTAYQLLELARPNHPLFRQLLLKAPGTYHHAIIVSNMAERAAEAIGADALLARVGSYYHDIGKTTRPYYFVENQTDVENPHDKLDPLTSADIITSHPLEGVALGRKHGLPERVLDFMTEHHGTTLVTYFYRRATQAEDAEVDETRFRYAGPRPRSRETAIVMLADSIEAWTRASHPASAAELERGIRQIISNRLVGGQLEDCELTLKDLNLIREAFVTVLRGVYHPRIQYPARETRANGRSST
jgi:hypothetical protein